MCVQDDLLQSSQETTPDESEVSFESYSKKKMENLKALISRPKRRRLQSRSRPPRDIHKPTLV